MNQSRSALREHLYELRVRLLIVVAGFLSFSAIGYLVRKPLTHYLITPLHQSVYFTTPQGGFEFFMRVIMTVGIIGAVPIATYQLLRFVEPAIGKKFRRAFMHRMFAASIFLVIVGVLFGYFIVLPTTLEFFGGFAGNQIHPLISANDYLTLVLGVLATFALIFQLPLIISIIDHIKPLTPDQLTRYRRHVLVGSLILAVLLPFTYDPLTQFIMAAPIIGLYEASVLVVRFSHRLTRQQKRAQRIADLVEAMRQADLEKTHVPSRLEQAATPQPTEVINPTTPPQPIRPTTSAHIIDLRSMQVTLPR